MDIYLPLEYSECEDPVKFIKRLLISYIVIASDISGQLHYFLFKWMFFLHVRTLGSLSSGFNVSACYAGAVLEQGDSCKYLFLKEKNTKQLESKGSQLLVTGDDLYLTDKSKWREPEWLHFFICQQLTEQLQMLAKELAFQVYLLLGGVWFNMLSSGMLHLSLVKVRSWFDSFCVLIP